MNATPKHDEWSVEPVRFAERDSLVASLVLLLQAASRIVEMDTERPNVPERVIR
jgi:hypothetical protein